MEIKNFTTETTEDTELPEAVPGCASSTFCVFSALSG